MCSKHYNNWQSCGPAFRIDQTVDQSYTSDCLMKSHTFQSLGVYIMYSWGQETKDVNCINVSKMVAKL